MRTEVRSPKLVSAPAATYLVLEGSGSPRSIRFKNAIKAAVGTTYKMQERVEGHETRLGPLGRVVEALHDSIRHRTQVIRDSQPTSVDLTSVVPGDIVLRRTGDLVPADLRLIDAKELECDEAVLTGEAMPKSKT